ncbi:MAG: glutamate--tRNA ligase, partial [Acidobacteriota bacterium]
TPEELDRRRKQHAPRGKGWKYDRSCRKLPPEQVRRLEAEGRPSCLRFLTPKGSTAFDDLVHGIMTVDNAEIEDFVLVRSDETPTYNLSCVCDDIDMRITHVIRGDDHISNTPKQILLYRALDARAPRFGHLPLILGPDRKRLSKRHGAVSVTQYRRAGYLPEALVNFLALLGWSPGGDRELMPIDTLIRLFSFEGVGGRGAVFDADKLLWMNGEYIRRLEPSELASRVRPWLEAEGLWQESLAGERREWLESLLQMLKGRCPLLADLARSARPFLTSRFDYDPDAVAKRFSGPEVARHLALLERVLCAVEPFDEATCEAALRGLAEKQGVKAATLIHPARVALTGSNVSPGLFEVMALMGRESVVARLRRAVHYIQEHST